MRIKLAENFRAVFYAPFYATKALGFYAREGVDVELLNSAAPGGAASALDKGEIDITWGGPMRVMKARDEGNSSLVCFGEVVTCDPFFLVGHSDRSGFRLEDLPHLRLATVSEVPTPWLCLQHDLRERGIDPSGLNRVADRTMASNLEALRGKQFDVIQVFEPYASMALREGIGDILYTASARGPTVYTTFLATRAGVERHRAAFACLVRAIGHMQHWLAEHGPEELADVVLPFYPEVPRDVLASSFRRYRQNGLWSRTPAVSRQGFARLAESLLWGGFISRVPEYEDCVDQTLG